MASGTHHHVGSPPRGPQTYVTKASKATSSRIASGLKPNLLTTAEAYSLVATAWQWSWATCEPQVALPLLGTWLAGAGKTNSLQFCWKRKHGCQQVGWPPLGLQTWITKAIRPHQAGSSPPWNPTSLSPQPCGHCLAMPMGNLWTSSSVTSTWKPGLLGQSKPTASSSTENVKKRRKKKRVPTSRTLTWTPNLRHWSQAEYFLLETQTAWDSRGPYLWAHCRHPACLGESKPTAAHAAEIAKSKFPEVGSPLLGNWNSLKIRAIFMAIARHPQVGSPPLGCRTYVAKASKATLSRITSCLKPNQLETAEAYSPVVTEVALPLLGNPACPGKVKNQQPPVYWMLRTSGVPK